MEPQFDLMGRSYESSLTENPGFRMAEKDFLFQTFDFQSGDDVLDFAAGSGFLTIPIAKAVGREGTVLAVDSSATMLSILEQKAASDANLHVLKTADPLLSEVPDGSFDKIVSLGGFHHVMDQACVLQSLYRILRPGGMLGILDFADNSSAQDHFDILVDKHNPSGHHALFLSPSRAANLARYVSASEYEILSPEFTWDFSSVDEAAAFFILHHGLKCSREVARDCLQSIFKNSLSIETRREVRLPFRYISLLIRKGD